MTSLSRIRNNVRSVLDELPGHVQLVAAGKTRTPEELLEAVEAGVGIIGENYVQEAETAKKVIGSRVKWHFIGHLQKNKVNKAVDLFDMIETVDSVSLAERIDRRCEKSGKVMPVLVEVNSGEEPSKSGVMPEDTVRFIEELVRLSNIEVRGLMTMGPFTEDPEDARPCFARTRSIFTRIRDLGIAGTGFRHLSMGMTGSYRVAIEEGADMVRIGTLIFGEREYRKKG